MSNTAVALAKGYPHQTTRMSNSDRSSLPKEMHGQFLRYPLGCDGYGDYVKLRAKLDALFAAPARIDEFIPGNKRRLPQWLIGKTITTAAERLRMVWLMRLTHRRRVYRVVLNDTNQVIREYGEQL